MNTLAKDRINQLYQSVGFTLFQNGKPKGTIKDSRLKYGNITVQLQVLNMDSFDLVLFNITEENSLDFSVGIL